MSKKERVLDLISRFNRGHLCKKFTASPLIPVSRYNMGMRTFIALILISSSVSAAECRLTGILLSEQKLETSMGAQTMDECRKLLQTTSETKFFGLVEEGDILVETRMAFKTPEGSRLDSIRLEPSEE